MHAIRLLAAMSLMACAAATLAQAPAASEGDRAADELIRAIDAAGRDPKLARAAIDEALRRAAEKKAQSEIEARDAQRRIDALKSASEILDRALKSAKEPAPQPERIAPAPPAAEAAPFDDAARLAFAKRFEAEIWPKIAAGAPDAGCFSCHGAQTNKTPLELPAEGQAAFLKLLRERYFEPENPSALLAKLGAPAADARMPPPPRPAWSDPSLAELRAFVKDLYDARRDGAKKPDEEFPPELEKPFGGPLVKLLSAAAAGRDNTFLTYYQLRRKIQAVFGDDWSRNERDLFNENLELFQGADFQRRYNESSKPSASYLAGLELLAADVASKAYLGASGPFEGWPAAAGPEFAMAMEAPSREIRDRIARLYRKTLFRDPRPAEIQEAFDLLRNAWLARRAANAAAASPSAPDWPASFELTVTGEDGAATTRDVSVGINPARGGIYQERVDERPRAPMGGFRRRIGESFPMKAGARGQSFAMTNLGTSGLVVFGGVELVGPLPERASRFIPPDDPATQLSGPWSVTPRKKATPFVSDGDANKGGCSLRVELAVERDGDYEVYLHWPAAPKRTLADGALVEVASQGPTRLFLPEMPAPPPAGEAHFIVDQTEDRIPYVDLRTSFRFASDKDFVEISNAGTRKRVTADAVNFLPRAGGPALVVDNTEAEGRENWPVFDDYPFRPYNIIGADCLSDKNARKGELTIRYKPAAKKDAWKEGEYYRVQVVYAAQESNETRVPLTVKAAASSPIAQISMPNRAPMGATVVMDASSSYNLQRGPLKFEWRQIGGPKVELSDAKAARAEFKAVPPSPAQSAWEALARALVSHPDFMFTRPPSLERPISPRDRRRLGLVKIAQDLVARPPSEPEFAELEAGAGYGELVDGYLASKEFEDFYFRRIRLYLESHGSDEEDEAARLWVYVATRDLPFQEIVSADYTVDKEMKRVARPAYHGRTGVLTMKGFIKGKPGLPHFNYAAQVAEKFLGYVFEVPPEIVAQREAVTAISTTNPTTVCYSCHKILTPLAYQRLDWDDDGNFRTHDSRGVAIDSSDQGFVPSYPFRGEGMEAFATQVQRKERFIRTMIDTHFTFYFGRSMRCEKDERDLYRRLWNAAREAHYSLRGLVKAILLSPEYLGETPPRARVEAPRNVASSVH